MKPFLCCRLRRWSAFCYIFGFDCHFRFFLLEHKIVLLIPARQSSYSSTIRQPPSRLAPEGSMLSHDPQHRLVRTNEMETAVPLFERERRQESAFIQRLQDELTEAKAVLEAQARRQSDLEYVNEDLEHRLEKEAYEKIELEALRAKDLDQMQNLRHEFESEMSLVRKQYQEEVQRRQMVEERLRRVEKELYRMHQKKYDIERRVMEEMSQKKDREVSIYQDIANEYQHSKQQQQQALKRSMQQQNPQTKANPSKIRTKQAFESVKEFFGIIQD